MHFCWVPTKFYYWCSDFIGIRVILLFSFKHSCGLGISGGTGSIGLIFTDGVLTASRDALPPTSSSVVDKWCSLYVFSVEISVLSTTDLLRYLLRKACSTTYVVTLVTNTKGQIHKATGRLLLQLKPTRVGQKEMPPDSTRSSLKIASLPQALQKISTYIRPYDRPNICVVVRSK